jgi:hypothetical protein
LLFAASATPSASVTSSAVPPSRAAATSRIARFRLSAASRIADPAITTAREWNEPNPSLTIPVEPWRTPLIRSSDNFKRISSDLREYGFDTLPDRRRTNRDGDAAIGL